MVMGSRSFDKAIAIKGWMTPCEMEILRNLSEKAKVIIEVGCYQGRSTRVFADFSHAMIHAVDPWAGHFFRDDGSIEYELTDDNYVQFVNNLWNVIDNGRLIVHRKKFEDLERIKADLIFIDADHRYEAVKSHIEKALELINPGGIIAGHDIYISTWPGVEKAVKEVFGNNYESEHSIWWTYSR